MKIQREVYRIDKAGSMSRLKRIKEGLPLPQPDECRVKIHAIGLNFADVFAIFGLYSATPKGSFIPGLEFAGEIEAVGEEVRNFQVGDKVFGVSRFGAYASHLNQNVAYLRPLPKDWSFAEGAAFSVQALTAWYALFELGNLQEGMTVLVQSAAGGVGIWANRIAKQFGATTIGAVGSAHKLATLQEEGYDFGLVRGKNFAAGLAKITDKHPLDRVLECIGGEYFRLALEHLAPEGRVVVYGAAQYASPGKRPNWLKVIKQYLTRPKVDPMDLIPNNHAIMGFNLIWLYERTEKLGRMLNEMQKYDLGRPKIGEEFQFAELKEALARFQTRQTVGKVVVHL